MKLYVPSDIHLEFGDCVIENKHNVDVLILSDEEAEAIAHMRR